MEDPAHEHREYSATALVFVIGFLIGVASIIVFVSTPFATIVGRGAYDLPAAMHGTISLLYLFVATIALYLGWKLYTERVSGVGDLQLASVVMSTLSLLTIVFGNWIYIPYRASDPNSVKAWLLANNPDVHRIFFEFKEFTALFTLPLSVAAAFILWRYGNQVIQRGWMRVTVALLLALGFFYLVVAFGLGAAVTKIRAI